MTETTHENLSNPGDMPADDMQGIDVEAVLRRAEAERDGGTPGTDFGTDGEPDGYWSKPYVPFRDRPTKVSVDPYLPDRMRMLPHWQRQSPPPEVAEAYAVLSAAVDVLDLAGERLGDLAADERTEQLAASAAVAVAVEAGKTPKASKRTDWADERTERETRYRLARENADAAQKAYQRAVKASLPEWRASVVSQIAELHDAAQNGVQAAAARVAAWQAAVSTGAEIERLLNPDAPDYARTTKAEQEILVAGVQGMGAAARLMASTDVVTTGAWLSDDEHLDPPRWFRAAMMESEAGYAALSTIEADEEYEHTALTKNGEPERPGRVWG